MTDEELEHCIASILDHPSVYMGGPSLGNRRKANRIIEFLRYEGLLKIKEETN